MKALKVGLIAVCAVLLLTLGGCMTPEVEQAMAQKDDIISQQDREIARLTKITKQMENERGMAIVERDEVARRLREANELLAKSQTTSGKTNDTGWRPRSDGSISVTVLDDVLFAPGKWELTGKTGKAKLAEIAADIKKSYPDYMIRIEGYTDSDPVSKSKKDGVMECNMDLSYWRAKSVYDELLDNKLSDRMMTIGCYADTSPKASKSECRRVEIVVLPKIGGRSNETALATNKQ